MDMLRLLERPGRRVGRLLYSSMWAVGAGMSDLSSNNPTLPWVSDCARPCDSMYRGNGKHFRDGSPTAFFESGREASHQKTGMEA